MRQPEPRGSNGIAIAPALTRDGHALLLINPHTSFFFRSEQQVTSDEGLNAYGAATWGQFFIYQGFNPHAGWMHTSSGVDVVDEFAQKVVARATGSAYRYGSTCGPMVSAPVTIRYRTPTGAWRRADFTTYRTHHGPIVRVEDNGRWVAFAMMNRPVEALQQIVPADQGERPAVVHGGRRSSRPTARTTRSSPTTRARSPICTRSSCRAATTASTTRGRSTAATRRPIGAGCTR